MGIFDGIVDFFSDAVDTVTDFVDPIFDFAGDAFSAVNKFSGSSAVQTGLSAYAADRAYEGQIQTNQANVQLGRDQMAFSAAEAEKARAFNQEEALKARGFNDYEASVARAFNADEAYKQRQWMSDMSATQWQRAVGDLSAAGLNPMLAYMKGGNAFGGGAAASVGAASGPAASGPAASPGGLARVENPAQQAISAFSSAANVRRTLAELDNISATNDKIRAETRLADAQTQKVFQGDIPVASSQVRLNSAHEGESMQRAAVLAEETIRVFREANVLLQREKLTRLEMDKVQAEIWNAILQGRRIQADTGNIEVNTKLHELQIPSAQNMSEAQKTWWMQHVAPFLRSLGLGTGISIPLRVR